MTNPEFIQGLLGFLVLLSIFGSITTLFLIAAWASDAITGHDGEQNELS